MYLIDHVAELRFVNRLLYAIKRIYTVTFSFSAKTKKSVSRAVSRAVSFRPKAKNTVLVGLYFLNAFLGKVEAG